MKKICLLLLCFCLVGCTTGLPGSTRETYFQLEKELEAAHEEGEITKKELLDMKLRNYEARTGNTVDIR